MTTENTITKQLARYIASLGYGTLRKNLFIHNMPDKPDNCVAVIPTGGFPPNPYIPLKNPTFQIRLRDARGKEDKVEDRAHDLSHKLQSKGNITFVAGGHTIHYVEVLQEPAIMGMDENERPEFVFNVRVNYVDEVYT